MKILDVYLLQNLVGQLLQDPNGRLVYTYSKKWLDKSDAFPLSNSLPLKQEPFSNQQCQGFFAGLLPEESIRRIIAKNLGISANNDFAMLEQIGGECAGAVSFISFGTQLPETNFQHRQLTDADLAKILRDLPIHPLMAGEQDVRLSLAGAQNKLAIQILNDQIFLPLNGAPSTHIIKPAMQHLQDTVINEAFCLQLAEIIGFPVVKAKIAKVEDIDFLQVARYDRFIDAENKIHRLHQEDFCQALAIPSIHKYQNEGGPSLKQSFDLLREISQQPVVDIKNLIDLVIFNFIVGNNDAHAKNFSILYAGNLTHLAPAYDILSTVYYPQLSNKMAMKIGGEYAADKIYPRHFEKFSEEVGLAKPMVKNRVLELIEIIIANLDQVKINHPAIDNIANLIAKRCIQIKNRFIL